MAIFETFTLLFKADSGQLKKEVDDVKKKTSELTDVSKKSEEQAKKTDNEFSNLGKTLAKVATAYFGVGAVIAGFRHSIANTTALSSLSRELNVNVETLDIWSKAIKNFGGDAGAFQNSIRSFAKTFNTSPEIALKFFPQLGDFLKKFTPVGAQIYGQEILGLDPDTIAFLLQDREAIVKALEDQKALGAITQKDTEVTREFNKEIGRLADAIDKLFRVISLDLLPPLTSLAEATTNAITAFSNLWEGLGEGTFPPAATPYSKRFEPKFLTPATPKPETKFDWNTDYGWDKFRNEEEQHQSYYLPANIPSVTNSQAANIYTGDITVNTAAKDAKGIAVSLVDEIGSQGNTLLRQLQQSNSYFDNTVVI